MKPHEVLKGFTALQWEAAFPDSSDEPSIRQLKKQNLLQALKVKQELLTAAKATEAARRLSARHRLGAGSDGDVHTPPTQRVPGPGVRTDSRAPPPTAAALPARAAPAAPETRSTSDNSDPIVTTAGPKHAALTSQGLDVSTGLDKRRRTAKSGGIGGGLAPLPGLTRGPAVDAVPAMQDGWHRRAPRGAARPAPRRAGSKPSVTHQRSLAGTRGRKQRVRMVVEKDPLTQEAARAAEAAGKQPTAAEADRPSLKRKQPQEEASDGGEGTDTEKDAASDPILDSPTQLPPGGLPLLPRAVLESPAAAKRPRLGEVEALDALPASDSVPEEGATPAVGQMGGSGAAPGSEQLGAPNWSGLSDLMAPRSTPSVAAGVAQNRPAPTAVAAVLQRKAAAAHRARGAVPPPPRFDVDSIPETPEAFQNISGSEEDLLRGIPATFEPFDFPSSGAPGVIPNSGSGGGLFVPPSDEATPAAALRGSKPTSEAAEGRRSRLGGGAGGGGAQRGGSARFAAILAADMVPETEVEPVTVARPVPAIATAAAGTTGRRLAAPQSVLPTLRGISPALRLAGSLPASFSLRLKFPQPPGAATEATPAVAAAATAAAAHDGSAPPPAAVAAPDSMLRSQDMIRALPLAGPGQPCALRLRLPLPVLAAVASADGRHLAVLLGSEVTWEPTEVMLFSINLERKSNSDDRKGGEAKNIGNAAETEDDSQTPVAARVVASIPVQRSRHAVGMPITPSALALGTTARGDPVLLLSAIFELAEGPLTSERPTVHALVCGATVNVLGVETDDPLFALSLTGQHTVVAAGYGLLGALTLEFDPEWQFYNWGRPLPAPPGAGLPSAVGAASGASGAGLDDFCTLVRCIEGAADEGAADGTTADRSEGAALLGLTATGLAGSWDTATRAGLAAGGSETWALRAAVPLGSVAGVLGVDSDSPCFAALLQPRDGEDATAVAVAALAPGAGLALGAPLPLDDYVTALAALRPGGPVLLGCSNGGVRVWCPASGACSAPLAACGTAVTAFAAAPAAGLVAVASITGELVVMAAAELEAAVGCAGAGGAGAAAAAEGGTNAGE